MKKLILAALVLAACGPDAPSNAQAPSEPPPPPPAEMAALVGEYSDGADTLTVLERDGELWTLAWEDGKAEGEPAGWTSLPEGYQRIELGGVGGEPFRITPLRPADELRTEALAATPPDEEGDFRDPELVELVTLDPTILLDVRYASTNNFMGEVFYSQPRAFLQKPAAEALVRAHHWLNQRGYGLLIHDGYRPWYVTKMFWDATPEALRTFVANPANGSRHNRGCAVDLTLYWLDTGEVVEMPGGYDEFSPRSYPGYQGGTSRQRWHRELLRQAMEAQDFTVYEAEWWHFDYKDWRAYRVGNQRFEELGDGADVN